MIACSSSPAMVVLQPRMRRCSSTLINLVCEPGMIKVAAPRNCKRSSSATTSVSSPRIMSIASTLCRPTAPCWLRTPGISHRGCASTSGKSTACMPCASWARPAGAGKCATSCTPMGELIMPEASARSTADGAMPALASTLAMVSRSACFSAPLWPSMAVLRTPVSSCAWATTAPARHSKVRVLVVPASMVSMFMGRFAASVRTKINVGKTTPW